jgi:hypothetical protein
LISSVQLSSVSHFSVDPIIDDVLHFFAVGIEQPKSRQVRAGVLELVQVDHVQILSKL